METRTRLVGFMMALLAGIGAVACQPTGSRAGGEAPANANKGTPTTTPAYASPGKPLPPIEFAYTIVGTPAIGQPLEIRIVTRVPEALADLNLALSGDERLQIPIDMARARLASAAGNAPITRSLWVTPTAAGTLYLNALVQAEVGGRLQSRAVTIPIRVAGGGPEAPSVNLETDARGEAIISLPAQDTQ